MPAIKTIFAWELGGGMGHATRLRPIVEHLQDRGAEVKCLAVRHQDAARLLPCPVEPAPRLTPPARASMPRIAHLADSLIWLGWDQRPLLRSAVARWRAVLEAEKPDALVMDCAPTALLAAQGLPMRLAWLANGWSTPPDIRPIPDILERFTAKPRDVPDTEPQAVVSINACLADLGQDAVVSLADLMKRADLSPMLSIPEIDPHGPRPGVQYLGVWGRQPGATPPWPPCANGPGTAGIFAYLKPFPRRAAILELLARTGRPTLAYTPRLNQAEAKAASGGAVGLFDRPIDWLAMARDAAFIVCHGSSGMTGHAIQMGLPVLAIPLSLEQLAVSAQAASKNAAAIAMPDDERSIAHALHRVQFDESIAKACQSLRQRYADYKPDQAAERLACQILATVDDSDGSDARSLEG